MELIPKNSIPDTVDNQIQCIIGNKSGSQNPTMITKMIQYFNDNNISFGVEEIVDGINRKRQFMKDLRNIIFKDKMRFCGGVSGLESKSFEDNDLILYSVADVNGKYYLTGFATIILKEDSHFILDYLCGDLLMTNIGKSFLNFIKKMVYSIDKKGIIELESIRNEVTTNFYKSQNFRNNGNLFLWKYHNNEKDRKNMRSVSDIFRSFRASKSKYLEPTPPILESYHFDTPTSLRSIHSPRKSSRKSPRKSPRSSQKSPRRTRKDYFLEGFLPLVRKSHVTRSRKSKYSRRTI